MTTMERTLPAWAKWTLAVTVYAAGHYLLSLPANFYWFPPAGWRFLWLLFTPMRLWPALLFAEWAIWLPDGLQMFTGYGGWMTALTLARMLGLMSGPWLLRRTGGPIRFGDTTSMQWLLSAILISAVGNALFNTWRPFDGETPLPSLDRFLQIALGDTNGALMLVPLGLLLLKRQWLDMPSSWRRDTGLVLLPSLLGYGLAIMALPKSAYFFATALCALPVLYLSLRNGWRGVAIALPAAFIAVALADPADAAQAVQIQLFLAITGISGLLLGASVDELNARNKVLESANLRLDRTSDELRDAARRNLAMSEDLRRWITSEVHDELGQNLTALQTRMKLVERGIGAGEQFAPLWRIVASMRQSISGLMASLRPAGLDEFGMVSALQSGSIRELAESAGLAYQVRIEDRDGLLAKIDKDTQTAIYRIVQEAATNAVRHAEASSIEVLLRARRVRERIRIGLSVSDDGRGSLAAADRLHKPGIGLQGIRDRVLVLGGRMRLRSGAGGTLLLVAFAPRAPR